MLMQESSQQHWNIAVTNVSSVPGLPLINCYFGKVAKSGQVISVFFFFFNLLNEICHVQIILVNDYNEIEYMKFTVSST